MGLGAGQSGKFPVSMDSAADVGGGSFVRKADCLLQVRQHDGHGEKCRIRPRTLDGVKRT